MPRVSSFYGIVIYMYFDEIRHEGRPHFHAVYRGREASIDIRDLSVLAGALLPRAFRMVSEWAGVHRLELIEDWERARRGQKLISISPLP
ncbi:MAG: DUF4160 domain-containing protein [Acidimicrobiales bacterium]